MKSFKKNTAAESVMGNLVQLVIVIVVVGILALIGIYINEKVADKTALAGDVAASARLTFTSDSACGEFVNVTAVNGSVARFRFNITGINCPIAPASGQTNVSIATGSNSSTQSASDLSTAINANGTLLATMTSRVSGGTLYLEYRTYGSGGNSVTVTESITNGSWSSTSLAGGTTSDTFFNSSGDAVDTVETGMDFVEIIVLAIVAGLVIFAIFSFIPIKL